MSRSVFTEAAQILEGRFTTDPADRKRPDEELERLTGYAAMMSVFGVDRDSHAIAYNGSEWPILAERMSAAFDVLDEVASEQAGRDISFMVWANNSDRTLEEVSGAFAAAALRAPQIVATEPAELRPSTPGMLGVESHRWIICNLLGTIAYGRQSELASVIRDVLRYGRESDLQVINRLDATIDDDRLSRDAAPKGSLNVELARAWGSRTAIDAWFQRQLLAGAIHPVKPRALTFSQFIEIVGQREFWDSCTDEELGCALQPFTARLAGRGQQPQQ